MSSLKKVIANKWLNGTTEVVRDIKGLFHFQNNNFLIFEENILGFFSI